MTRQVDAAMLKKMIADGDELALLDVREDGQFGEPCLLADVTDMDGPLHGYRVDK